jgi:hypothetical protein
MTTDNFGFYLQTGRSVAFIEFIFKFISVRSISDMTTLLKTEAIVPAGIVPNQFPKVLKSYLPFSPSFFSSTNQRNWEPDLCS